jgi:flagellar biosynthesis chaperone FliJ
VQYFLSLHGQYFPKRQKRNFFFTDKIISMNDQRRKQLKEALQKLEDAAASIEICKDEEQEYYDNMPEGLQGGEKGDKAQEAIDGLEEALTQIDDAIAQITEVI